MKQYNDAKLAYLQEATGETDGDIGDLELLHFENLTGDTGQINDLKVEYYEGLGFYGNLNDMEEDWLELHGYNEGSMNDRWMAFYLNPPVITP